jgi:hypothetical protein
MTIEQFITGCADVGWGVAVNYRPDGHMNVPGATWHVMIYKQDAFTGEQKSSYGRTWEQARDAVMSKAFRPSIYKAGPNWTKPPELIAAEQELADELRKLTTEDTA